MKKAIVSVINDLATDQRVDRTCRTLTELGYKVTLIGRRLPLSPVVGTRKYATRRMNMLFTHGPLFYLFFNARLFFYLLFSNADLLVANDLDTLWPNKVIASLKGIPLIYDTHEIFCDVPELVNRPRKRAIWMGLERRIFPKLKNVITVNASIARYYSEKYNVKVGVVRNIPVFSVPPVIRRREELGLPPGKFIVIMQGAGINVQRGAEELLMAVGLLDNVMLIIAGGGDVIPDLRRLAETHGLKEKIIFIPRQPFNEMIQYTMNANLGATLDKDTNINYRFSLPNKLFDYIHCGIPVLASKLVEVKQIVQQYDVGVLIDEHSPASIAAAVKSLISDKERYARLRANTLKAATELNWEKEAETLKKVISSVG